MNSATVKDLLPPLIADLLSAPVTFIDNVFADGWKRLYLNSLISKRRLRRFFEHQKSKPPFSPTSIVLVLIVSILLGYKRLRDVQFFKNDPVVLRLLGLTRMPTVSTISRQLSTVDDRSIRGIERLQQSMVTKPGARSS